MYGIYTTGVCAVNSDENWRRCKFAVYLPLQKTGAQMQVLISNSDGRPIYEQIESQIKSQILTGKLCEGQALPSIRLLAKDLRISVITTKRAYDELERDGFIETIPGKGSFVASKNPEFMREEHLRMAEGHIAKAVEVAKTSGIEKKELAELLDTLYDSAD